MELERYLGKDSINSAKTKHMACDATVRQNPLRITFNDGEPVGTTREQEAVGMLSTDRGNHARAGFDVA